MTRPPLSLGEGDTPLVRSRWIGPRLGLERLSFKLEQTNPTGSYKDRFAARLISQLLAGGHRLCLGSSSGNTGASLAAYAAAGGLTCVLFVPAEAPEAKLTQIAAYGAHVVRVRGLTSSPAALRAATHRLTALAAARGVPLGVSAYAIAPEAMAGIEPLAGELASQLGGLPDRVFCPVGGGGLLTATWRGFRALASGAAPGTNGAHHARPRLPAIHAAQPSANDTIVSALLAGERRAREVSTVTRISGLAVPLDLDASAALDAVRSSGGQGHLVEDEWVWEVQALLARHEGLYVEPAGAASVAALWRAAEAGQVQPHEQVVCLLTGHGLKDEAAGRRIASANVDASAEDGALAVEEIHVALLDRLEMAGQERRGSALPAAAGSGR